MYFGVILKYTFLSFALFIKFLKTNSESCQRAVFPFPLEKMLEEGLLYCGSPDLIEPLFPTVVVHSQENRLLENLVKKKQIHGHMHTALTSVKGGGMYRIVLPSNTPTPLALFGGSL